MKRFAALLTVLTLISVTASFGADVLRLRNGSAVEGTFMGGDTRQVRFLGPDGAIQNYAVTDVVSLEFSAAAASAAPAAPVAPVAPVAPAAAAPARAAVTIPAGTTVTVRMIDSINSDITGEGERFRASIDDPIVVGGQVVIPRNADATVQVVKVAQSGTLKGSDEVALKLFDVTVDGKAYELATNYAVVKSSGKGASTAKTTAVTTGVGAALGGIFGGGKGAAIGAGAGAGTGVAISAARGKTLKIPSESRLDFVLRAPLPLN